MTEKAPESPRWVWERTPTERLVIRVLQDADRPLSRTEIKQAAWTPMRSVDGALSTLIEDNRVQRVGSGDGDCRWRYTLS